MEDKEGNGRHPLASLLVRWRRRGGTTPHWATSMTRGERGFRGVLPCGGGVRVDLHHYACNLLLEEDARDGGGRSR